MEKKVDHRLWEELLPEMLGLIFKRLGLEEKLVVVPGVCKAWEKAVKMPYCWQEIDIHEWSVDWSEDAIDEMLELLIERSCGSLQKLSVYGLKTEFCLSLISDNANNLRSLELPGSEISNCMVEQIAEKLSNLTYLDLSYCRNIGAPAIEAIGKHCKKLTHFKRNMRRSGVLPFEKYEDAEALAIAATMPQLKHLELANMKVTTEGVLRILSNCVELEFLDVKGCRNVKLDDEVLKKRSKLTVMLPDVDADTDTDDDVCCWNFELAKLCQSVQWVNGDMVIYPDDDDDG